MPSLSSITPLRTEPHAGPNDIGVSLLPSDNKDGTFKSYPLVISPKTESQKSLAFLSSFMNHNKDWIDDMMLRYGALLFRGFHVVTAKDVEDAVMSYEPNLNNQYRGTSPRHTQGNTEFVFSAAEVPSHYPIAQHIEMSFLPEPPKKLFFSALKAPAAVGGETALADFRKVYNAIPKDLRDKLQEKKLRYTRTHKKVGDRFTHDVAAMLSWSELFRTNDKKQVEKMAAQENMPMRWEGDDTFVSEFETEAFQRHPQTGEAVWFNHAQVFHWTSFPAELFAAFRRTKDLRYLMRALLLGVLSWIKYGPILRQQMALHVAFGDGMPLSIWEMHQIRKAVHENTIYNRWQQGDVVMIDNFSTSHGRQPTYDKGRNIVVAWSDPLAKKDAMANEHLTNSDNDQNA
ncbi:Taurine catabolism dioxygenase TauD, TfdA family [Seminavis robusta]|uniref:Taurine catabolism dioxygenase TauD, TfdA family n=1 Tax=Seminavis robusta TaxID=568900 RepID=A0A9N8DP89_9STRA|nr:Taurine catabolism dioxygenase TauD, TfdA family [Seminavis robusta]|eukprot:Sro189_g081630.1 Taurine catabolism dioxygenase TauD, TfdA family (401) ;mRNA; f:83495-84697